MIVIYCKFMNRLVNWTRTSDIRGTLRWEIHRSISTGTNQTGGGGVAKLNLRETINPEILRETKNSRDPRSKRGS
jgi:hypothetical protein